MYKKINKTIIFLLFMGMLGFLTAPSLNVAIKFISTGIITLFICSSTIIWEKLDKYSPYIVPLSLLGYNLFMLYIDGFSILMLLLVILTIFISTLYHNPVSSLIVSIVSSLYFILIFLISKDKFFYDVYDFIKPFHIFTIVASIIIYGIISYIQCKSGKKILKEINDRMLDINKEKLKNEKTLISVTGTSNNIKEYVNKLEKNFSNLIDTANNISNSMDIISLNVDEQCTSVDNSLSTLQKLVERFNGINEQLRIVQKSSEDTEIISNNGTEKMQQMNVQMKEINETVESLSKIIHEIKIHNNKIVKIIEIIKNISNQTNLLSLNASIEAATAKEYGKGFAVVANEIKNLSNQTEKYAKEIEQLINSTESIIENAIIAAENTVKKTVMGVSLTNDTINSFYEILNNITNIKKEAKDVSNCSQSLLKDVNDLFNTFSSISEEAQSSNSSIEEINSLTKIQLENINNSKNILNNISNSMLELNCSLNNE